MKGKFAIGAIFAVLALLVMGLAPVSAGGPVCKVPPMCGPPPVCGPQPCCGPPPCPPPCCGPPPCGQPNPLARVFTGAFRLVTGVVALPFKLVDRMIDALDCSPQCGRPPCGPPPCAPPMCGPPPCPPPMCAAPVKCGPPVCGPGTGYPPAYGMRPPPVRSMGYGTPKAMSPMSKKSGSSLPSTLMATPAEGVFGSYW
jgi:DNA helicase MCM8